MIDFIVSVGPNIKSDVKVMQQYCHTYTRGYLLIINGFPVSMFEVEEIGSIVEKRHDEIVIEWKIADFLSVAEIKKNISCPRFSFAETTWCLQLKLRSDFKREFMYLYIRKMESFDFSVEYSYGLSMLGGWVQPLSKGVLEGKRLWKGDHIKLSTVQRLLSVPVPSDTLIIVCTLKLKATNYDKEKLLENPKVNKLIKLDTLSENFKSIFVNKDNCDTTLYVTGKEYKAHRAVLIARSSVFAAMFQHETREKQEGIINIPDCDPESFEKFLRFLYCGKLEELSFHSAVHLYETSDKYEVLELKTFCAQYLMESLTVENVCDVVVIADKYEETDLLNAAQEFFNKNGDEIFDTSEWDSFVRNNYHLSKKMLKGMYSKMKLLGC